jgi:hypothetical protein
MEFKDYSRYQRCNRYLVGMRKRKIWEAVFLFFNIQFSILFALLIHYFLKHTQKTKRKRQRKRQRKRR